MRTTISLLCAVMLFVSGCVGMPAFREARPKAVSGYVPVGVMPASLIAGGYYAAGEDVKPSPTLFRINSLEFLPPRIVDEVAGCYVVAEGRGDLATERVYYRLSTLACVTKDKAKVINLNITGYIASPDGRSGLTGLVKQPVAAAQFEKIVRQLCDERNEEMNTFEAELVRRLMPFLDVAPGQQVSVIVTKNAKYAAWSEDE
ncbi:hypothetical protein [Geobacter sp. AOG2]|uniref:hypothetical protein n=1 Tax=Geobacter sp. AOG2 TaxID=1566347 RepID=UPI001CC7488D|nr:hypothetical protein [Geobacter sp. AOG2]GFE60571.1 hypothetical protein AOG2_11590 [Geobacter sp. AOG2]